MPKFFGGFFCLLAALVWDYGPNSGSQFCQWDLDFGVVKSINEETKKKKKKRRQKKSINETTI